MMRAYLAAMDAARGSRRLPTRVLGALGPKMMELAGTAADGAHTYFAPVAHTAAVRAALGPDRWLAPTQMVGLDRERTRGYLQLCLGMPNYTSNLLRFGLEQADLDTTSDRLVDALVVPAGAVTERVAEQRAAGANQVVLQVGAAAVGRGGARTRREGADLTATVVPGAASGMGRACVDR